MNIYEFLMNEKRTNKDENKALSGSRKSCGTFNPPTSKFPLHNDETVSGWLPEDVGESYELFCK